MGFAKSVLVPPENEKYCIDNSHPERTRIHYVTHRSHCMQKHMVDVTCPPVLVVKSVPVPPEHENSVSMFLTLNTPECIM
jgi:hypothetical protein